MQSAHETVVWLIRHGSSTFNLEGRCQGCSDEPELTASGREAARLSGERLRGAGLQAIISSPLRRATHTAMEIADVLDADGAKIPLKTDDRLREIELPQWEGLPISEIPQRFPDQFQKWRLVPGQMSMRTLSGLHEFPVATLYRRVRRFWQHLLSSYAGRSILLVTHGGTGRALLTTALGLEENCFHSFQQSNCGISRLRFSAEYDHVQLELLNDTAHLSHRLPKLKEGRTGVRLLLIPATDSRTDELRQIASVLTAVDVEAVFTTGLDGKATALEILPHCAQRLFEPVHEEVLGKRLRMSLENESDDMLRQIAVVAPPDCLQRIVRERLGLSGSAFASLLLTWPGITAIHCPGHGVPPVLQAMNIFETEFSSMEVQV